MDRSRLHTSPETRKTHAVAKGVHDADGGQAAGPEEEEGGVGPEQGRVGQLEDGAQDGRGDGDPRVRDAELVEVVDVRQPEDERREEDGPGHRCPGDEHQRYRGRSEEDFLGYGALDDGSAVFGCRK